MCVLAFAFAAHPRRRLVGIANRDEFHERPAAPLAAWDDGSGIVAGRDLRGGGTWLGVSASRFVALTNLRSDAAPDPDKRSRGGLVTDLLAGSADPATVTLADYNPLSLVVVEGPAAWLLTNRPKPARTPLAPGIHGLTNGPFERPWPKLAGLKHALAIWLDDPDDSLEPLFAALRDERVPAGAFDEATASPVFIRNPVYGTRCSTVVTLDADGRGTIAERRFDPAGTLQGARTLAFAAPSP